MTKEGKIIVFTLLFALGFGGWYFFTKPVDVPEMPAKSQYSFSIGGEAITLIDGRYEKESTPGSASKTLTTYFGNEVKGDFNSDGKEDTAFLVMQTTGGSGTFFYLATTLGGEAVLLGDRIAPQTTEYRDGNIIVNYAERKTGEPMTARPSIGVSKYFEVKNDTLVEIVKAAPTTATTTSTKVTPGAQGTTTKTSTAGTACEQNGGTWSEQYKECTGIDQTTCSAIKGTFNECASACRHDPNAQVCTLQCVLVCTF